MERTGWMPPLHEGSFTRYAHTPDELAEEVRESGFMVESLVAIEGIAFALSDLDERMDDPRERDLLLHVLDVGHPHAQQQFDSVHEVLSDIGVRQRSEGKPEILLLNKTDTDEGEATAQKVATV